MIVQTSVCKEAVNKGFAAEHLNFNVKTTCIHACFYQSKLKLLVSAFNKVNASKLRNPTSHLSRTLPPFSPAASQLTCHHHTFNLSPCSIILISAQRKYSGVFVSDHFICEEQPPIHSIHSFCLVSRPNVVIEVSYYCWCWMV